MTCDHNDVAGLLKTVHADLRRTCQEHEGDEERLAQLWLEHTRDTVKLGHYAVAMEALATQKWRKDVEGDRSKWIADAVRLFYRAGRTELQVKLHRKLGAQPWPDGPSVGEPYRMLDVGSCFNPLAAEPGMEVTAIDLHPASADSGVLTCDFLNVDIGHHVDVNVDPTGHVISLPACRYHAVVFSLLLGYLPTTSMRWRACVRASELLTDGGVLAVAEPDSSHEGRNAGHHLQWKLALATIGLYRFRHEKLTHLRCSAYVKVQNGPALDALASKAALESRRRLNVDMSMRVTSMLVIPQDRTTRTALQKGSEARSVLAAEAQGHDEEAAAELFLLLPDCCDSG